jgi:hypothetical protein
MHTVGEPIMVILDEHLSDRFLVCGTQFVHTPSHVIQHLGQPLVSARSNF